MTEVMSNNDFYRDVATAAMAAYNESGTEAADKLISELIASRYEDSFEREYSATQIAKIIAGDFEKAMDEAKEITEQEELPLEETQEAADVAE